MLFSDWKKKDVVNLKDAKKLGRVCDLEFDECNGCIRKMHVRAASRSWWAPSCEEEVVLLYKDICKIGPDIILVDIRC
jgi:YlmC/YmxH family sporulation protein